MAQHDEKMSWEEAEILKEKARLKAAFEAVDWSVQAQMISVWPSYIREQLALAKAKNVSKTVDIDPFTLKSITGGILLDQTRLYVEQNKKVCLIGDNGTGKTTMFAAMANNGVKGFPKHVSVHHCQELEHQPEALSVIDTVVKSHEFRNILLACKGKIEAAIAKEVAAAGPVGDDGKAPVPTTDTYKGLKANLDMVDRNLYQIQSDSAYERASAMLRVLGFDEPGQKRSLNALSGGLRMRVALCSAFFIEADLLLLDDPSNHLDFPSVLWLENRLRSYRKGFVMVSHDRELLENSCNSVMYLENKQILYYNCGFAEFEKKKAKDDKKKAEDIEKWLTLNRNVDPASAAGKEKKEKNEWLNQYRAREIMLQGKFTFPPPEPLPGVVLANPEDEMPELSLIKVDTVRFSYDVSKGLPFIFDDPISIDITTKTRMGVMGPNGAGKSTFLKLITNKLTPNSGTITRHPTATVAYFAQHHVMELNLQMTPMEFMISQFPQVENTGLLRNHLSKVGIAGTKADTRMIDLSGGQRSCIMFAKLTYVCPHLLIMDEPTNFLDLLSVDSLIAASKKYRGALLLVTHNRYFMTRCAKQYLSIVPGQFLLFDELSKCEKATYTFIAELEAGGDVNTSSLIKKPSDAASVNLAKQTAAAGGAAAASAGPKAVITLKSSAMASAAKLNAAKPAAAPAPAAAAPAPAAGAKAPAAAAGARPQSAAQKGAPAPAAKGGKK